MEVKINVPEYDRSTGFKNTWEPGFEIEVKYKNGVMVLVANKAGLISLATQLLTLAQDTVPSPYHIHFDEHNSLESGSIELIIQKK